MKNINWLDHIANLLVVILGISIAFYLEGYKEESNNRNKEKKYLASLIEDLETDIEAIDTLLVINERITKALVDLSNASINRTSLSDSALINNMFSIQYNPPFTPQRTTYESLKSSGRIDLIKDFELRNRVIEIYEQSYRGSSEYDLALSEHVRDFVKPFYIKNVKFKSAFALEDDFLRMSEFRNITFSYRYLFQAKNRFYTNVLTQVTELKDDLTNYQEVVSQ